MDFKRPEFRVNLKASRLSRGLEAAVGGANLQLLAAVSEVGPQEAHRHARRSQILLDARIDEGLKWAKCLFTVSIQCFNCIQLQC